VTSAWYTYAVSPIDNDWDWERLPLAESVAADIAREYAVEVVHARREGAGGFQSRDVGEFLSAIQEAKAAARKAGWEGDYGQSAPRVFWLPDPEWFGFKYGFAWKQSNNGTTFIVSPFRLPWLE
jgi:hypothetical protein